MELTRRSIARGTLAAALSLLSPAFMDDARAQLATIGSGTGTSSYFPNYYLYNYAYSQTIYTAAELTGGGAPAGGGTITKIYFKPKNNVASTANWKDWVIYMGNTAMTSFSSTSDWVPVGSMTQVYNGTLPASLTANNWFSLTLSTPFVWDGTSNLVVAVDENTPTWGTDPSWAGYTGTANKTLYFYTDDYDANPSSPPTTAPPSGNLSRTNATAQVQFMFSTPCSGTPAAGITASISSVCTAVPFTLNASPIGGIGLTYEFQVSTDGGLGWSSITAAGPGESYVVPSQSVTSQYRVIVTCATGGTDTSAPVTVTQNAPLTCYCTPTYTYGCTDDNLDGFVLNGEAGTSINHTGTGCSVGAYGNFTSMSATLYTGAAYPGTATTTYGFASENYKIWIDFNDNGLFEAGEALATGGPIGGGTVGNFTLNIPADAPLGTHRMRVRLVYGGTAAAIDPCALAGWGETHDYTVNITTPPPCTGTPTAGTATLTPAMICSGGGAGMILSGYTTGFSGISIQWQQAASASGPFADIPDANSPMYTETGISSVTYYRARVTCAGSASSAYSDTLAVQLINTAVVDSLPGSRCDPGPVTLSATPGAGATIEWYDAPLAGTLLASGNNYTTPSLSTTTTYYAQAVAVVADDTVGMSTSAQAWYSNGEAQLNFDAYSDFTLASVMVYPYNNTGTPTGTITISLQDHTGATVGTITETVTGTLVPVTPVTINLNFEVPADTGYSLHITNTGIDGYLIDEAPVFPFTLPGIVSITDAPLDADGTLFYWGLYNWHIKAGCEGPRVPVTATIGGTPVITAQPAGDTLCAGQALTLSVGATGAATYQWYGPLGAITGANSASYNLPAVTLADAGDYSVEVIGPAGCGSATSAVTHVMIGTNGQWMGFSTEWNDAANWCGGVPTATTDAIIPASTTIPFQPMIMSAGTGKVKNLSVMSSTVTVNGTLEIYGDATATAGGALDAAAGTLTLAGAAAQNIEIGFNAQNLNVNGGGQKTMGNDAIVTGALALNSGILNLGATTLTLWPGATTTGGSATAYVKTGTAGGLKQQVGATAARFPVGNSAYNPATISNTGTPDNITVRVRDEVLTSGYSGTPIAAPTYVVKRTWDIEEESAGNSNATLTLQWNAGEENNAAFDYNHVYIAHYLDGLWQNTCCADAGMAPAAGGSGPYTVTQSNITSFSPFTVASAGGEPLSVRTHAASGFGMTAYPNPVSEVLTVQVTNGRQGAQVSLTDVTGRELMARYVEGGKASFNMQALSAGVYFVKYHDGAHVQTIKIHKR